MPRLARSGLVALCALVAACGSSPRGRGSDAAGSERPDDAGSAVDGVDATMSPDDRSDADGAALPDAGPDAEAGTAPKIDAKVDAFFDANADVREAGAEVRRDAGSVPYRAVAIAGGGDHTCVLLDDGNVKCWGYNIAGQLGYGDTYRRGSEPSDMGDALPTVDLGSGHVATAVAVGSYTSCAILDDGSVKCWGDGDFDGIPDDGPNRGDQPGEMGEALPTLDLGPGRRARQVVFGQTVGCALLDDGVVKCWGKSAGSLTPSPVALGSTTPVRTLSGGQGILVLFTDGTATSLFERRAQPLLAPGARAAELHSGGYEIDCALLSGVVSCTGAGGTIDGTDSFFHYSAFDSEGVQHDFPGPTPLPPLVGFGASGTGLCAIFEGGVVGCQRLFSLRPCTPDWCVPSKAAGDGTFFIQLGQPAKALSGGCALLANGEVRCWDGVGYSPTNPDDALGSSFDFIEKNGQYSYGPFHSIDLGHH